MLQLKRMTRRVGIGVLVVTMVMAVAAPARATGDKRGSGIKHVQVGDVSLAYRSTGHGRPLLLLQGSGSALDVWDPLMIDRLSRHRRVIAFDYRGVGGSTDDPSVPMTIDLLAEDVFGLMKALHLRRADVLGWSMGGFVAQRMAELRPRRVRRVVLLSTDPGGSRAVLPPPEIQEIDVRATLGQATLEELFFLLFPPDQVAAGEAWLERYLSQPGCCESVPYEAGLRQLEAIDLWWSGPGAWPGLREVSTPTLVLHGSKDIDVPIVNGRMIANRLPNASLVTFNDAGHGLPLQEPKLVAGLVNGFLG